MRIGETLKKAAGLFVELDSTSTDDFYKGVSPAAPRPVAPHPAAAAIPTPSPGPSTPSYVSTMPAPAPASKTIEQVVRESPGPNLDEIKVTAPATPVVSPDGTVDFLSIYRLAGLPASPFTAEQVIELMCALPAELPLETKRATLKVTVKAMAQSLGVTPDSILADASRKLAALAAYAQSYVHQADEYVGKAELEIGALEQEIAKRRQSIAEAKAKQSAVNDSCHQESDRLDDVLEFFSLDVPPSKYAG